MKLIDDTKSFKPVTILLETQEEVNVLHALSYYTRSDINSYQNIIDSLHRVLNPKRTTDREFYKKMYNTLRLR